MFFPITGVRTKTTLAYYLYIYEGLTQKKLLRKQERYLFLFMLWFQNHNMK